MRILIVRVCEFCLPSLQTREWGEWREWVGSVLYVDVAQSPSYADIVCIVNLVSLECTVYHALVHTYGRAQGQHMPVKMITIELSFLMYFGIFRFFFELLMC